MWEPGKILFNCLSEGFTSSRAWISLTFITAQPDFLFIHSHCEFLMRSHGEKSSLRVRFLVAAFHYHLIKTLFLLLFPISMSSNGIAKHRIAVKDKWTFAFLSIAFAYLAVSAMVKKKQPKGNNTEKDDNKIL